MKEETIFYIKKGRRYIPHSSYSSEFCDSFPKGTHLVQSYPGGSSRRFNIDPAYAPMIAAGRVAEDKISEAIMKANELRPQTTPITPAAHKAWNKLKKELGNEAMLTRGSAREAAEQAVKAMADEADKLLKNEAVRKAYEHFLLVCELTKEHNEQSQT
jgi:vacuolar-type H+-ATPase subunit H